MSQKVTGYAKLEQLWKIQPKCESQISFFFCLFAVVLPQAFFLQFSVICSMFCRGPVEKGANFYMIAIFSFTFTMLILQFEDWGLFDRSKRQHTENQINNHKSKTWERDGEVKKVLADITRVFLIDVTCT